MELATTMTTTKTTTMTMTTTATTNGTNHLFHRCLPPTFAVVAILFVIAATTFGSKGTRERGRVGAGGIIQGVAAAPAIPTGRGERKRRERETRTRTREGDDDVDVDDEYGACVVGGGSDRSRNSGGKNIGGGSERPAQGASDSATEDDDLEAPLLTREKPSISSVWERFFRREATATDHRDDGAEEEKGEEEEEAALGFRPSRRRRRRRRPQHRSAKEATTKTTKTTTTTDWLVLPLLRVPIFLVLVVLSVVLRAPSSVVVGASILGWGGGGTTAGTIYSVSAAADDDAVSFPSSSRDEVEGDDDDGERGHRLGRGGLRWQNLSVSIRRRRGGGGGRVYLLEGSSFYVPNGHVCGVIGPSGSGKSTLLAALGGTTLKGGGIEVGGSVWVEEEVEEENYNKDKEKDATVGSSPTTTAAVMKKSFLSSSEGEIAMLHQHDNFFSMLTPRETLELAARLQLRGKGRKSRHALVDRTIDSLGLGMAADRTVGDRALGSHGYSSEGGGLSGGERRRLSLALELITSPRIFLADEPTTGLDSSQAEKVVGLMSKLARERNVPCVFSLHQPRASIWKSLDSFVLLAPGGKVCYIGPRADAARYFERKFGFKVPPETNPAEFFIDLVSIDTEDPVQAASDRDRIDRMASAFASESRERIEADPDSEAWRPPKSRNGSGWTTTTSSLLSSSSSASAPSKRSGRPTNILQRISMLFLRAWRQNARNSKVNLLRLAASVGEGILFAELFATVKPGKPIAKSVADRTALLSFGVINMVMLAVMKTLHQFGSEKVVVTRERMRNQYSSFEYLFSKAMAEIPLDASFAAAFAWVLKSRTSLRIPLNVLSWTFSLMAAAGTSLGFALGSVAPTVESAMALGVPVTVVLMAVGIINPSGVDATEAASAPAVVRWLKVVSPIKWAIEALLVAEFRGMDFAENDGRGARRRVGVRWRDLPRMGGLALVQNGDQVLDALGLANVSHHSLMKSLAILTGANLLIGWFGLTFGGPNFLEAEDGLIDDFLLATEGGAMDREVGAKPQRQTAAASKNGTKKEQLVSSCAAGETIRHVPTVRAL